MNAELFKLSLLAKGFAYDMPPCDCLLLLSKPSAGLGGDIGYTLDKQGVVHQVQFDGGIWNSKRHIALADFEDNLSPRGLWQPRKGKQWTQTGLMYL